MNSRTLVALPAGLFMAHAIGCSATVGHDGQAETTGEAYEAASSCPKSSAQDDQLRAAATVAFNIMRDAAKAGGSMLYNSAIPADQAALAPQRYRLQGSGTGIEFDPTDGLYRLVSNQMKADLALAQLDASVAKFLSDGLKQVWATTDGWHYPSIRSVAVLANYTYPGPTSRSFPDPTSSNNSHKATATGQAWCGTSLVNIDETVEQSWQFSPLLSDQITTWRGNPPPSFKGKSALPGTPFNGPSSSGNPYLVVSVNGKPANWASYNFAAVSCYPNPNFACAGKIQIDPVPYAEPGQYYDTDGVVGTQSNPYELTSTILFAVPDHASQWATRTVNGIQEWGTFTQPVTLFGTTFYRYIKQE